MGDKIIFVLAFLVILAQCKADEEQSHPSEPRHSPFHLLENLILNHNRQNENNNGTDYTEDHSRVKRQSRGRYYPLSGMGGGAGYPGNGARGYGGRGFGGRGMAGRGYGGRGIGGRGGIGGGRGGRG